MSRFNQFGQGDGGGWLFQQQEQFDNMPDNFFDGNMKVDYGLNHDGIADQWAYDTNDDGKPDQWAYDGNSDGKADQWAYDTNGDGTRSVGL